MTNNNQLVLKQQKLLNSHALDIKSLLGLKRHTKQDFSGSDESNRARHNATQAKSILIDDQTSMLGTQKSSFNYHRGSNY